MKSFLFFIFFFFTNISIYSQISIQWENTIGGNDIEWNDFIQRTSDGNCIIGGYSYSNISGDKTENSRGANDFWLIKLNSNTGSIIWQKTIGGSSLDYLTSGMETKDGGFILGGYSSSDISGDKTESAKGADDYWIIKLDANRNIVWQKTYGGGGIERLSSILPTDDGGYILGGYSTSGISGNKTVDRNGLEDVWVIKTDAIGNIQWQKAFGGSDIDNLQSIIKTSDGSYVLVCYSMSNISGNKTENNKGFGGDYWIIKINTSGDIIWQKTIGGNNGDYARSGLETSDGNYLIAGESASGISGDKTQLNTNNSVDVWLLKLNKNSGNIMWQKTIGGDSTEWMPTIQKTSDNGFIMQAMSSSGISGQKTEPNKGDRDYWAIKLNSNGEIEWDKTIGGSDLDEPQSIIEINPNEYICSGWSRSDTSGDKTENKSGLQDNWVVKFKVCSGATSNSPICIGQELQLNAFGGSIYSWTGPNGFTSTDQNPILTNVNQNNSGTYYCTITGTSGGCDATLETIVKIGDTEKPIPNSTSLPTITGDCNTVITTTPTATDNCSGLINATTTDALSYSKPGNYTIHWSYDDGNGNIETQDQNVTITSVDVPTTNTPQYFCIQQNATLNDIAITGQNIKWYDAPTNGNLLFGNTVLQNNSTYYASKTINGCESNRIPVIVNITTTPSPSGDSNQSFCTSQNATLYDIQITGNDVKWYDSATNGNLLNITTPLQNNTTYFASQTQNGCESIQRAAVTIELINTLNATNFEDHFCDDNDNKNLLVNLSSYQNNLITNTNGSTFSYYKTKTGAENQYINQKINNFKNYTVNIGSEIIFVRIDNINTCHQIVELTLNLYPKPKPQINNSMPICEGSSITINPGIFDAYEWSTGATSPSITITAEGDYWVTVGNNYNSIQCETRKDFKVLKSNIATIENILISDMTTNDNQITVVLNSQSTGDYEFSIDGVNYQSANTFTNLPSGEYTVYVNDKNGCGLSKKDIYLLMYPKYFTPNGDGYNDTWGIKFSENKGAIAIKIFNRFGKLLKTLNSPYESWNGIYQNERLPSDDYWFTLTRSNGVEYKGHFSLKR